VSDLARVVATDVDRGRLVRVSGEIDLSNARNVLDAIGRAVPRDAVRVVVDLSGTDYLDSAGISMLFALAERVGYRRQELSLVVPPSAPIRAVLELTSLTRVVQVLDSME
jgi:anti-anti-sigma factor